MYTESEKETAGSKAPSGGEHVECQELYIIYFT
jgi:hypothetical protein